MEILPGDGCGFSFVREGEACWGLLSPVQAEGAIPTPERTQWSDATKWTDIEARAKKRKNS